MSLGFVDRMRLGAMQALADQCSDAPNYVNIFTRLSQKKDKSAATRASAATQAAYWAGIAASCAAPKAPPPPPQVVQPAITTGGGYPVLNPPVPAVQLPAVNVPLIMPQNYGPPHPASGAYIAASVPADVAAMLTQQQPMDLSKQNSPVPTSESMDECALNGPKTYDPDGYGEVQVLQVICA